MSRLTAFARENGWSEALLHTALTAWQRLRSRFIARRLHAPGFRVGRAPRLRGLAHMRIGRNVVAGDNLWLDAITLYEGQAFTPRLALGDNLNISDRVHIGCLSSITIGSGTLIGSAVLISDHTHGVYRGDTQTGPATPPTLRPLHSPAPIRIGSNVWLGDRVAVLAGADIGDGAIIGAGSIVTGIIPAATIALGTPARPVRRWDEAQQQWLAIPPGSST